MVSLTNKIPRVVSHTEQKQIQEHVYYFVMGKLVLRNGYVIINTDKSD